MIKIHKEGHRILLGTIMVLATIVVILSYFFPSGQNYFIAITSILFMLVLQFFRNPNRQLVEIKDNVVYAPADGKVVVIEETFEEEYFKSKRIQVSIFMSPTNVHVQRNPISGTVNYFKYHAGKYLVAWHPKSSTENERTTVVIKNKSGEILMRQIAGAMAKRIVSYVEVGDKITQGQDQGFIKFGSRVDLFLPLTADIKVSMNQKVKGNRTVIATL